MLARMNSRSLVSTPTETGCDIDRRRETRVRVDIAARMKSLNPLTSTGPSSKVRIVEISYHGMKLRVHREMLPGGLVQIIVGERILMGKVRHTRPCGNDFEVGIRLTERIPSSLI
jgi:hypothetical protein